MLYLILCFFLMAAIGLFALQAAQNQEDYCLGGRRTSTFGLTSTLVMTELNPATLVAFSTMGYLVGLYALWLPFVFLVGLSVYALTVARKWQQFDGLCISDWFRQTYGRAIGLVAASCLLIAMAGFSAAYVKSMSLLFQTLAPQWSLLSISAFMTLSCLMFSLRGGLPSIIWIDKLSFIAVMALFPCMFGYIYYTADMPSSSVWFSHAISPANQLLPSRFILSIICITSFTYILAPWYGQKVLSAKSSKVAFVSVWLAAMIVFAIYGLSIMTTSLIGLGVTLEQPQTALSVAISLLPPAMSWAMYAVLFLIGLTTLCGVWSAMATLMISSVAKPSKDYTKLAMGLNGICALLSFVLGNTLVDQVLDKLILANIPVFALAFSLYAGFYWRKANRFGAWASILTGITWGVGTYLYYGEQGGYTWYWAIWGVPIILAAGLVGSVVPSLWKVARPNRLRLSSA